MPVDVTHFGDPACPFDFSAEPVRWQLRWHYGDQLTWRTCMIVLTLELGEAEKLAAGAPGLQRRFGMPVDPAPYARASSSEPACRAVVAARLNAPAAEEPLLRRLRVRRMIGGLLDDPELIAAASRDVGLEPAELAVWCETDEVRSALQDDIRAARTPTAAALARGHKLGGPFGERRYTAPSYEFSSTGGATASVPGFNPFEAYETAVANLAPGLVRLPPPESVEQLLLWAGEPLATAEVAAVLGDGTTRARTELGKVARPTAAGADFYWTLD